MAGDGWNWKDDFSTRGVPGDEHVGQRVGVAGVQAVGVVPVDSSFVVHEVVNGVEPVLRTLDVTLAVGKLAGVDQADIGIVIDLEEPQSMTRVHVEVYAHISFLIDMRLNELEGTDRVSRDEDVDVCERAIGLYR